MRHLERWNQRFFDWGSGKAASVLFRIEKLSQEWKWRWRKISARHIAQSKACSIKTLLTGSQISPLHTCVHKPPVLPVGLLFIREEKLLGGDRKYNFCQPIRGEVSDEVISTIEFRGVKRWGGEWKLSSVSTRCLGWSSWKDKVCRRIMSKSA